MRKDEDKEVKTDINGCSTTQLGREQWEEFYSPIARDTRIQYDYRTPTGKLFSCVAKTLEQVRQRRDKWLKKQTKDIYNMTPEEKQDSYNRAADAGLWASDYGGGGVT